ncbi:hypothetical protein SAMN05216405_5584 [Lachnospiraceae bacterium NLAE-zl-G231]|nr:hypothetical protein SAMN05216405_5584 [Lachnospiraceae bacterium NLAE-zl-G231]
MVSRLYGIGSLRRLARSFFMRMRGKTDWYSCSRMQFTRSEMQFAHYGIAGTKASAIIIG